MRAKKVTITVELAEGGSVTAALEEADLELTVTRPIRIKGSDGSRDLWHEYEHTGEGLITLRASGTWVNAVEVKK